MLLPMTSMRVWLLRRPETPEKRERSIDWTPAAKGEQGEATGAWRAGAGSTLDFGDGAERNCEFAAHQHWSIGCGQHTVHLADAVRRGVRDRAGRIRYIDREA